ncbi:MAG TPA: hypothetical protein VGB13_04470 [Candidatus Krumholzibacteria bacterium]
MTDHTRPCSFGDFAVEPITQRPNTPAGVADAEESISVQWQQVKHALDDLAISGMAAQREKRLLQERNEALAYALRLAADTLENSRTDLSQRIRAGRQIREMLEAGK